MNEFKDHFNTVYMDNIIKIKPKYGNLHIIVAGYSSTGKSTFCKTLSNMLENIEVIKRYTTRKSRNDQFDKTQISTVDKKELERLKNDHKVFAAHILWNEEYVFDQSFLKNNNFGKIFLYQTGWNFDAIRGVHKMLKKSIYRNDPLFIIILKASITTIVNRIKLKGEISTISTNKIKKEANSFYKNIDENIQSLNNYEKIYVKHFSTDDRPSEIVNKYIEKIKEFEKYIYVIYPRSFYILHISDLHFGDYSNASLWFTQLTNDLVHNKHLTYDNNCAELSYLFITGDIASISESLEYRAAYCFLEKLSLSLKLPKDKIIIVPGNHDLKRRLKIQLKFRNFREFYEEFKGKIYPENISNQYTLDTYPERKLIVLGLNSAWNIDRRNTKRISINMLALSTAIDRINREIGKQEGWIKIAIWHHPTNSEGEDRITDYGFLELLFQSGFQVGIHGHVHRGSRDFFNYDHNYNNRTIKIVAGGTFGAIRRDLYPAIPWQYNIIKIDDLDAEKPNHTKITVFSRKRERENGSWEADTRWYDEKTGNHIDNYCFEIDLNPPPL